MLSQVAACGAQRALVADQLLFTGFTGSQGTSVLGKPIFWLAGQCASSSNFAMLTQTRLLVLSSMWGWCLVALRLGGVRVSAVMKVLLNTTADCHVSASSRKTTRGRGCWTKPRAPRQAAYPRLVPTQVNPSRRLGQEMSARATIPSSTDYILGLCFSGERHACTITSKSKYACD